MTVVLDDELAEAALRAAAKAGFSSVVEGLIKAGVDVNSMNGAALIIAERYGDPQTIDLLRRETLPRSKLFPNSNLPSPI